MNKLKLLLGMKRCSLFACALMMSLFVKAEEGVLLKLKSGAEVGFVFASQPKIITGAELVIKTAAGVSVSYDYAEVSNISFGEINLTDISDVKDASSKVVFRLLDGKLSVEGLKEGESVSVYNVSGKMLHQVKQSTNDLPLQLPLTETGVLIIRTSTGVSYKLVNK